MWFRFSLAETGRKVPWKYASAPHIDTELFEITPSSPITLFMYKDAAVEFWPIPEYVPGRNLTLDFYEGALADGLEITQGFYPLAPAQLRGTPLEGGKWSFTVKATLS